MDSNALANKLNNYLNNKEENKEENKTKVNRWEAVMAVFFPN